MPRPTISTPSQLAAIPTAHDSTPPENIALAQVGSTVERAAILDGETRELLEPGPTGAPADRFTLSRRRRQELGVRDDETYTWALNSDIPSVENIAGAWIDDTLDANPGARVLRNKDGKSVRIRDLVCIVKPKALVEKTERSAQAKRQYDAEQIRNQSWDGTTADGRPDGIPADFNKMMADPVKKKKALEQARDVMMEFMKAGDTHGMTFKDAMRSRTPEMVQQEETFLRRRGRPAVVHAGATDGKTKSTHAIGASFDKSGKLVRA